MSITRDQYDSTVLALKGYQPNSIPAYNDVAVKVGVSEPTVRGIWLGTISRPKPPKAKVDTRKLLGVRQVDGRTVAIGGRRLRRGPARKCKECNRKFFLLYETGRCQACQPEYERNQSREYL